MEATEQTPIENNKGLESFASAWANVGASRMRGRRNVQRPKSGHSQGHRNDLWRISEREHLCNASIRKDQSRPSRAILDGWPQGIHSLHRLVLVSVYKHRITTSFSKQ